MDGTKNKPLVENELEPLGMTPPADSLPMDPAKDDAPC